MKTIPLISTLAFCWGLSAQAQGVHLSAGDTLAIGFDGVDLNDCFFDREGLTQNSVLIAFGIDILSTGESLRLELFENNLSEPPFATQSYSPQTSSTFAILAGGESRWSDQQGIVRVSMINGSVDVDFAHFIYAPRRDVGCPVLISVPEPGSLTLSAFGGMVGAAGWYYRRKRNA